MAAAEEVEAINEQMNELDLTLLLVILIKKLKMIVFLLEVGAAAEEGEEEVEEAINIESIELDNCQKKLIKAGLYLQEAAAVEEAAAEVEVVV